MLSPNANAVYMDFFFFFKSNVYDKSSFDFTFIYSYHITNGAHQEPAYNYVSESQKSAKLLWWPSIGRRRNPLITKEAEKYE